MKLSLYFLSSALLCFLLFWFIYIDKVNDPIRIACVGDSITFGHGIEGRSYGRKLWAYPSRLNRILGRKYLVKNFGKSGATVLNSGDLPYSMQPEYEKALQFEPDIVIFMLGTNDSKPKNWIVGKQSFKSDYLKLLQSFSSLKSNPTILIGVPLPVFSSKPEIDMQTMSTEIVPIINEISHSLNYSSINFPEIFKEKGNLVPDDVHPNSRGHKLMAESVKELVQDLQK